MVATSIIALIMGAASASETSVNIYLTTRLANPEDNHLHSHRRENLKFRLCRMIFIAECFCFWFSEYVNKI
jgi:hypothetical protein